ncbi:MULTISPECIES: HlyD family secretion protein [unclassified Desulfurobacterium]|uniref:HlyD family secretion protein n=1 Tax=Desulfurobacterium sp. TC5-1 TaxID=1158318 RepID=UPI0003B47834|nr:HlyD family secretion protein [Desulfurobacterium sp. TC5-1]
MKLKRFVPFLILMVVFTVSCSPFQKAEKNVYVSGRIEGDEIDVGTKVPGRVARVFVHEGDDVEKGETLAVLDSKAVLAKVAQAEAALKAAEKAAQAKEEEVKVYKKRLSALIDKRKSLKKQLDFQLKIAREKKDIAVRDVSLAEEALKKAKAVYERAKADYERFKKLYEKKIIPRSEFDKAEMAFKVSMADFESAKENLAKAEKAVKIAQAGIEIVKSKYNDISSLENEIKALEATVRAKEKEYLAFLDRVNQAEAVVEEAKAHLSDTVIKAPVNGTVTVKYVNVGEVVPAGFRLFSIVNMDELYLKGFIPEKQVGLIHLKQPAYVEVDAYPNRKFPAYVSYVAQKAEFTPKEVQTKEERVKEVFGVKLKLKSNPGHVLKPGMPADGYIEIER